MNLLLDIIGWIGMVLLVTGFFAISTKRLRPQSYRYQFINLFGSVGIGVNAVVQNAYPVIALQVVWGGIALYEIYKIFTKK